MSSIASPEDVLLPTSGGCWYAGGGGGDIYTTAFLARNVFGQENPTLISVWGEPHKILTLPQSAIAAAFSKPRSRDAHDWHKEHGTSGSRAGLKVIIVCLNRSIKGNHLVDDFRRDSQNPSTGEPVACGLGRHRWGCAGPLDLGITHPDRDHLSFEAVYNMHAQLGNIPAKLLVALPGRRPGFHGQHRAAGRSASTRSRPVRAEIC